MKLIGANKRWDGGEPLSLRQVRDKFDSLVEKTGSHTFGCWEWTGWLSPYGYGNITWRNKRWLAHRFSWFLVHGVEPSKCLLHRCDNRRCVRPDHLFEGTRQENMQDKVAKGRQLRGETCPVSKLTEANVRMARALYAEGHYQKTIARSFHVDQSTISNIIRRKTWGHI